MKKKNNKGFSLIELIIAIAILVILTGLLAPQFMKYIEKSRHAKDLQTLDMIYTGVQGALTDEKAVEAVTLSTGIYAKVGALEDGMKLNTILEKSGADDFAKELANLIGTKAFELESKEAASGGEIMVTVNDNLEVGVYYADKSGKKVDSLAVGTAAVTETEKTE